MRNGAGATDFPIYRTFPPPVKNFGNKVRDFLTFRDSAPPFEADACVLPPLSRLGIPRRFVYTPPSRPAQRDFISSFIARAITCHHCTTLLRAVHREPGAFLDYRVLGCTISVCENEHFSNFGQERFPAIAYYYLDCAPVHFQQQPYAFCRGAFRRELCQICFR